MPDHVTPRSRVSEYVDKSDYDTYEILVGSSDAGIPVFVPLTEGTVLGRLTGGEIAALDSGDLIDLVWGTVTANYVFAGPVSGDADAPAFRALVADDIPDLSSVYSIPGHTHAHNDTTSKQGGTTGEYYHLTALQSTAARGIQRLTSANDTTYTLDVDNSENLVVVGSGVLYWVDLGDATTYSDTSLESKRFTIYNATNEFIGVKNSSGSVWHRVPPRAQCVCVLTDNATEAGVWFSAVCDDLDPKFGYSGFEDFEGSYSATTGQTGGAISFTVVGSGTAAAISTSSSTYSYSCAGRQGTIALRTGTTTSGYAYIYHTLAATYLGSGCRAFEMSIAMQALATAGEDYIARFGIGDNITGGAFTNGVYFLYDRATYGDFWVIRNIVGGSSPGNNTVVTAVAPVYGTVGTEWQNLRLEVNSTGARSDFWIDRVQVSPSGGLNTYLPTSSTPIQIAIAGITKTAGTTTRYARADYARLQSYPTSFR